MTELQGKVAIVTGSAQGIGRGIALELAKAGADIVITHLDSAQDRENADQTVAHIKAEGQDALSVVLDVTNSESITACAQTVFAYFPRIHILVNNAGVIQRGLGDDTSIQDLDLCYAVNLKGVWAVCDAFIPHFQNHSEGKIINIASVAGRKGHAFAPAYCASKAGVISLTQSLADSLGPSNINVNAVCPGIVWTPMWESIEAIAGHTSNEKIISEQAKFKDSITKTPLRRPQTVDDIGHAVVFLASPRAKNITGQALNIDGGLLKN